MYDIIQLHDVHDVHDVHDLPDPVPCQAVSSSDAAQEKGEKYDKRSFT